MVQAHAPENENENELMKTRRRKLPVTTPLSTGKVANGVGGGSSANPRSSARVIRRFHVLIKRREQIWKKLRLEGKGGLEGLESLGRAEEIGEAREIGETGETDTTSVGDHGGVDGSTKTRTVERK